MGFPLADWIDAHADVPHNLGRSGLGPTLPTLSAALARPREPDETALRAELAHAIGTRAERLFLTRGATEANALALFFLYRKARSRAGSPRCAVPVPEYPPIPETAALAGFRIRPTGSRTEIAALSEPNNPRGLALPSAAFDDLAANARTVLLDETFREFRPRRSRLRESRENLWVSGTFSKVYGADGVRVGFLVPPESEADAFARFHGLVADHLADASVSACRAILRDRTRILEEARARFEANLAILRRAVDGVARLDAPVWFDQGARPIDGDALARRALSAGVLVCPGSYFGDRSGVRVTLTGRSFARDLRAYLQVRDGPGGRTPPRGRAANRGRRTRPRRAARRAGG